MMPTYAPSTLTGRALQPDQETKTEGAGIPAPADRNLANARDALVLCISMFLAFQLYGVWELWMLSSPYWSSTSLSTGWTIGLLSFAIALPAVSLLFLLLLLRRPERAWTHFGRWGLSSAAVIILIGIAVLPVVPASVWFQVLVLLTAGLIGLKRGSAG